MSAAVDTKAAPGAGPAVGKRVGDGARTGRRSPLPPPVPSVDAVPQAPAPPDGKTDRVPKRRGRPARRPQAADVYKSVATGLAIADKMIAGASPVWAQMSLTPEELGKLAEAVGDEILTSERLTALFVNMRQAGPHAKFCIVVAAIALPRLAVTGKLPPALAAAFGAAPPVPVETGGAHGGDGGYGEREIDADIPLDTPPPVFSSIPEQERRRDVLRRSESQNGFTGNGESESSTVGAQAEI